MAVLEDLYRDIHFVDCRWQTVPGYCVWYAYVCELAKILLVKELRSADQGMGDDDAGMDGEGESDAVMEDQENEAVEEGTEENGGGMIWRWNMRMMKVRRMTRSIKVRICSSSIYAG